MKINKSFKYRLRLNPEQENLCAQAAGCCRYIWNTGLALKKKLWEEKKEKVSRYDLDKRVKDLKEEHQWLKVPPSQSLQQVNKDLEQAFRNFFNGAGYPKFKKKGINDSFRMPQGIKLEKKLSKKVGQVRLPKLGTVRYTHTREIEGRIKHVTVSKKCGKWYISFNCEVDISEADEKPLSEIGIDMGITVFAQCSDGVSIKGTGPLKKNLSKLRKLQRELSRKKKYSSNWKKTRNKISKLHEHISNIRKDFLHKASTKLAKNHSLIVMEDLKTKDMSSSAKGSLDNPGKNVKAKSALNRSILDQGWGMFENYISYKVSWNGGKLVVVNPKNTSIKCSRCGHTDSKNRKSQGEFECLSCGYAENADLNASKNILAEGHSVIACGVEALVSTMKQELPIRKPVRV